MFEFQLVLWASNSQILHVPAQDTSPYSYSLKKSADQGGCYPQRPSASVDNTLRDLQNPSDPMKAEFNNCFIIHLKYFLLSS